MRLLLANGITITEKSGTYETAAWGKEDVPSYYNQLLIITTEQTPHDLLGICLKIEKVLGRKREERWSSRTIDIDIIYYASWVILGPNLKIPHPYRTQRKFITQMLTDLNSDLIDPVYRIPIRELNEKCKDILEVTLIS